MEVKEGKSKHSWNYKKVGDTFEEDDGVRKSGEVPPRLMVLTSDKGWPYTLNLLRGAGNDFFINCEVDRVWQIVERDLTEWFSNFDLTLNSSPLPRVLIGTPGIGKSMAAGSYLLYQLLHYDVEKLQVVVHCFGETMYVFDKTTKIVTKYKVIYHPAVFGWFEAAWDERVHYLRCWQGKDTARHRFCALHRMGHDCGVIAKGNQL
ncbi:putative retrotransposon hot spot protein (RHS) [Trypanosoma cruzi]|uniref:Putative retrotransposon hot spot protein (RHS) n=1 Tax=Trypanosoma cruzi TaxID=5693 RepID=A0A2V2WEC6_TRYCR|nr:putative retrotransposon hot spot protein (RHS) [Trypanosoma cruzi]